MPASLPYLSSYKNVSTLFEKIASARIPDAFTTRYLADVLGLKGTNDRPMISLLKTMGFLDQGGKPTPDYGALKNPNLARRAIAKAIKKAYEPLFTPDEKANELSSDALKGLISQVAGTDDAMTARIAGTFNALTKEGDFSNAEDAPEPSANPQGASDTRLEPPSPPPLAPRVTTPAFHFNIQVHLPGNGTEETYLNIFNAIRKSFV
jgi:hypothetical protein